ncbi:MAG TPA: BTAD domain-containing putative transcriptional regulator, partial [Candidatus Acidoferrales bacterium]|nr:BTAD domain-containing putative transcriptional regulator [Candidatus Acidoferrales bacterium]
AILRYRPESGVVVVCSCREPLLFQFSDLAAPHLLTVFRRADLQLSLDELQALTPAAAQLKPSALYGIYTLTRGWPVPSMYLIAASARGAFDIEPLRHDHPALHELLDWIDKSVISIMPDELRRLLLYCVVARDSVPSDFDGAYGDDPARADRLLYRRSQRADLGYAGEIRVYPLLAFAVRARYASQLDVSARKAAEDFLAQNKPLRAVRAMISIGDLGRAAEILDTLDFDAARDLGGFPYPGLALEHHPRSKHAFHRYPLLWLNLVPCRSYVVPAAFLAQEGASILNEDAGRLDPRQRRWITATVSTLFAATGDVQSAQRYAQLLDEYADAPDAAESRQLVAMYLDRASGRFQSALDRWRMLGPYLAQSPVWYALHLRCRVRAEVWLGNFDAGIDSLRALLSSMRIGGCPSLAGFGAMEATFLSWLRNDAAAFKQYLNEFARIAQQYDIPVLWPCLCALNGLEYDDDGRPVEHHDVLAALIVACDERDPELGRKLAIRAMNAADRGDDAVLKVVARIVAVSRGVPARDALLAQAAAAAENIDSDPVKASVRAFAAGSGDIGILQPFADHIRNASAPEITSASEVEGLRIEVATGEIFRGTTPIKVSEGTAQLTMLLAVSGEISRDAIVDCLWPDLDGDSAANALKMCVHRARAQLGDPAAYNVRKAAYSLGSIASDYTTILNCAAATTAEQTEPRRIEYTNVFEGLARGAALGWAPWTWFAPYARALADAMRRLGSRLAEEQLEGGDPQVALQLARRMASVDPLDETARALLIRAYVKMGNWSAAIDEFRDFSEILKRDLGVEPSERLKKLLEAS